MTIYKHFNGFVAADENKATMSYESNQYGVPFNLRYALFILSLNKYFGLLLSKC